MGFWRDFFETTVQIALAVAGLAFLAIIVSNRSRTAQVIQASASGFSNSIATAISPVTGASATPILSYPTGDGFTGNFMPLQM